MEVIMLEKSSVNITRKSLRIALVSFLIIILLPLTIVTSFSTGVDIVGKTTTDIAPSKAITTPRQDDSEGQKRVVDIGNTLFAFWYNSTGSNGISYETSVNDSANWTTAVVVPGTGNINSDSNKWTMFNTTLSGNHYVTLLYWNESSSHTFTNFWAKTGNVSASTNYTIPSTITWNNARNLTSLFSSTTNGNHSQCPGGTGVCAAVAAATDTHGNVFAAYRWIPNSQTDFQFNIIKSTNGGLTWSTTQNGQAGSDTSFRMNVALTKLDAGKMLFLLAKYDHNSLTYRVYNGTAWNATDSFINNMGWSENTVKQISADSNYTNYAFVAFVTGGNSGNLTLAKWNKDGTVPLSNIEHADSTLSHSLPSITITLDGIHIYSISNGTNNTPAIYETKKVGGTWQVPRNAFPNTSYHSPDDLTAAISYPAALWRENSTSPYDVMYGRSNITAGFFVPVPSDVNNLFSTFSSHQLKSPDYGVNFGTFDLKKYLSAMDKHLSFSTVTNKSSPWYMNTTINYAKNNATWSVNYDNEPANFDASNGNNFTTPSSEWSGWHDVNKTVSLSAYYANIAAKNAHGNGTKLSINPSWWFYNNKTCSYPAQGWCRGIVNPVPSEFIGLNYTYIDSWLMQIPNGYAGQSQNIINNVTKFALPIKEAHPSLKIYVSVGQNCVANSMNPTNCSNPNAAHKHMGVGEIQHIVQSLRGLIDGIELHGYTISTNPSVNQTLTGIGR
jgi:hypothetical protein